MLRSKYRIRSLDMRTQLNQVGRLLISGQGFADTAVGRQLFLRNHFVRKPADGIQNVDRGIVSGRSQVSRENEMSVQNAAGRVANRFVKVVAFDQHREEAGDRSRSEIPGAFKNLGQKRKDGRSVALLAGRFSRCQSDFALRHGQARDGIHHQQHVGALIAEILSRR